MKHRAPRDPGFSDVLRVREFLVLFLTDMQSNMGDQVARVALSVLVFERTHSALLTALFYAVTFLPGIFVGPLLGPIADRFPRKWVMVSCDLLRVLAFVAISFQWMPLPATFLVVVVATSLDSLFISAESALVSEVLPEEIYSVGAGLRQIEHQVAQLIGFGVGGLLVAAFGAHESMLIDAGTFAVSAIAVAVGIKNRPPAHLEHGGDEESYLTSLRVGVSTVTSSPKLLTLLGFALLIGVYVIPEGLAAPYAAATGLSKAQLGLLLAAAPVGATIGAWLYLKLLREELRERTIGYLAIAGGVPLLAVHGHPAFATSASLLLLSSAFTAYLGQLMPTYVAAVPNGRRGQAVSIASAALMGGQGLAILAGGFVASEYGVVRTVAISGVVIIVIAALLQVSWSRVQRSSPAQADYDLGSSGVPESSVVEFTA